MEEDTKRNFQAIVKKFSHPAAIKTGNRSTQKQSFFISPESSDLASSTSSNYLLSRDEDDMLIYKNFNFEEIKDSSTQTSKTILELAQLESGEMSPDSLSCSPRTSNTETYNFNLDKTLPTQSWVKVSHVEESRSGNSILTKYTAPKGYHLPPNIVEPLELHKNRHPNQSLVEKFLRKNKDKGEAPEEHTPKGQLHDFKSRSCVETFHGSPEVEKAHPQVTRFTVKNTNKNTTQASFMMPTQASQLRNIGGEMEKIKSLISPTRRGRSISPRGTKGLSSRVDRQTKVLDRQQNVLDKQTHVLDKVQHDKIPYIDKSDTEITKTKRSSRNSSSSPYHSQQQSPTSSFAMDMSRIDRMSLTLLSSDDNMVSDPRTTDRGSSTSIDNLFSVLAKLQDSEWSISLKGLADVIDICRVADPDVMMPHMIAINQKLIDLLKSPRSQVCRTACQAAGHLFELMRDTRGPEFNDIVDILLNKTADSNKFIRQDANLALDCMVTHIPTFHSIRVLCSKGPLHKNQLVRSACARLIICAVVIAGPDSVLGIHNNEHTRKRIYVNMMRFLDDKNLETRKYGERLYKVLSKEPLFDHYLRKYIDREELERMKKILKFLSRK